MRYCIYIVIATMAVVYKSGSNGGIWRSKIYRMVGERNISTSAVTDPPTKLQKVLRFIVFALDP
jgi:hypothetical protein